MCLSVSKRTKEKVAPENYIVYKALRLNMESPYYSFKYELKKLYKSELLSYLNYYGDKKDYEQGLHYAKSIKSLERYIQRSGWNMCLVVECIVPKGATYINNRELGLGATNKLKIVRKYGTFEYGSITKDNS